jgi:hypothetical protein
VAADLAGASCGDVSAAVQQWMDSHKACKVDSDCMESRTACGLAGQCGFYANTGLPGAYWDSLLTAWGQQCAAGAKCTPCPLSPDAPPGCMGGVCGPKTSGFGVVGDPCNAGTDCTTGECLTVAESKTFLGGYCTVLDCDAGKACPAGSTCKPIDVGRSVCLKDCDPSLSRMQCRNAEGYACCWGPGPGSNLGWCSPTNSGLCQAR